MNWSIPKKSMGSGPSDTCSKAEPMTVAKPATKRVNSFSKHCESAVSPDVRDKQTHHSEVRWTKALPVSQLD